MDIDFPGVHLGAASTFQETKKINQMEGSSGEMISGLEKLSNLNRHRPKPDGHIIPIPTIS